MSELKEWLKTHRTGDRRPIIEPMSFTTISAPEHPSMSIRHQERYEMRAELAISFWVNPVHVDGLQKAEDTARRTIYSRLNCGSLGYLQELEQAVMDYDTEAAMVIINELRDELTGRYK